MEAVSSGGLDNAITVAIVSSLGQRVTTIPGKSESEANQVPDPVRGAHQKLRATFEAQTGKSWGSATVAERTLWEASEEGIAATNEYLGVTQEALAEGKGRRQDAYGAAQGSFWALREMKTDFNEAVRDMVEDFDAGLLTRADLMVRYDETRKEYTEGRRVLVESYEETYGAPLYGQPSLDSSAVSAGSDIYFQLVDEAVKQDYRGLDYVDWQQVDEEWNTVKSTLTAEQVEYVEVTQRQYNGPHEIIRELHEAKKLLRDSNWMATADILVQQLVEAGGDPGKRWGISGWSRVRTFEDYMKFWRKAAVKNFEGLDDEVGMNEFMEDAASYVTRQVSKVKKAYRAQAGRDPYWTEFFRVMRLWYPSVAGTLPEGFE